LSGGPRQVNRQSWSWRGIDVINAHQRRDALCLCGIRAAIETVRCGDLHLGPLLTSTFPLEELGESLETARRRPERFIKPVVTMNT
jgi:hypothetical protein